MYSSVEQATKDNNQLEMPLTQTILSGQTSSHYAGVAMKQTLMSSQLSNYVGIKDPMYKTSYSRMVFPL